MQNQRLNYAHAFANSGLYLFPCREDKRPHIKEWRTSATTDTDTINAWAQQFPNCRWGVECEASGLFVIDSDVKPTANGENTLALLETDNGPLPTTYTVKTLSGGVHRYFKGKGKNKAEALGPALDIRSVGGYVIAPDGIDYTVINTAPVAEAPAWAVNLAGKPTESKDRSEEPVENLSIDSPDKIAEATVWISTHEPAREGSGGDQHTLNTFMHLRDFGVSKDTAMQIIHHSGWNDRCEPPWQWDELQTKADNAYNYAKGTIGNSSAEAMFAPVPMPMKPVASVFEAERGDSFNPLHLPKRNWLMQRWFQVGQTTATVSPGGVGKSMISLLEAIAVVTGQNLTGFKVFKHCPVWYHSEDTVNETKRRVAAICQKYNIDQRELHNLHITSNRKLKLPVCTTLRQQIAFNHENINFIKEYITKHNIGLAIFDPLIKMHKVNENDNNLMEDVTEVFNGIAEDTRCSVHILHHAGKGRIEPGDMANARGATAIVDAVRIGRTLNIMTPKEAEAFELPKKENWYVRLDNGKANYSKPAESTDWFEKHSITIANGEEVGSVAPVAFKLNDDAGDYTDLLAEYVMELIDGDEITLSEAARSVVAAGKRFNISKEATARKYVKNAFKAARQREDGVWFSFAERQRGVRSQAVIYVNTELSGC